MLPEQINLIERNFEAIAPRAEDVATVFYNRLFALQPALQLLFPANLSEQKKKLMATLAVAIKSLHNPNALIPLLEDLGRRHALYGVREEYYETVSTALLLTLRDALGKEFTPQSSAAWMEMYNFVADTMKNAAREMARLDGELEINLQETKKMKLNTLSSNSSAQKSTSLSGAPKTLAAVLFCFLIFGFSAVKTNAATNAVSHANDGGASWAKSAL
jgi:nitric oxide dioxygenase